MPFGLSPEQQQLADAVSEFAARHAPIDKTRTAFDSLAAGQLPPWWQDLVVHGFHAVHLPDDVGGQGGQLADMACVIEAAANALLPGPLLSTATASAVALLATGTPAVDSLIGDLAAGATAALVLPDHSDFRAMPDGGGWLISGSSGLTVGICSAQKVILPAGTKDDGYIWLALDNTASKLRVEPHRGTDLTTDVGVLRLEEHVIPNTFVLKGIDAERARCIAVALASCAAAGATRWCVEAVTAHLKTREQFGRPIGSFQALQHRAAMLLVNSELATSAAWDAVRAAEESLDQHRLAAAAAAIMAVAPAPGLVLDALTMFGAIGYTWEHDLHLYWRRATSLAASIGSSTSWTRQLGELTRRIARDFSLNLGDAEADFRAQVGDVLDNAVSLSNDGVGRQYDSEEFATGPRRTLIADAGLVAPQWPAPWGRGATPLQQLIVADEFAKRPELIQPSVGIAEWILPTMLRAGSDTLRERFVAPTLRGELAWCQLFSEPGAGSDLASLTTRATRVDGGWLINGHKIWTSFAHRADFGALLARTDPAVPKHRGIGYFIIDMRSEGLKIFPIRQTTGRAEFNEVFFTDVFVPDDMVLGDPTAGWGLAIDTMAQERVVHSSYVNFDRVGVVRCLAEDAGPGDGAVLQALGEIDAYTNALKALGLRATIQLVDGQGAGPASSIAKVATGVMLRRAAGATLDMTGRLAMVEDSDPVVAERYLELPGELIGGGTAEVQLTIIAQSILGLPRS